MRIAMVGTGITRAAMPVLKEVGFELASICGTPAHMDNTRSVAGKFGVPKAYDDYGRMLEEGGFDVVYIGSPNHLHCSQTVEALEHGYHVIVEKPMASNDREVQKMADAARRSGKMLFEANITVYVPNFLREKDLVSTIGAVKTVNCSFQQYSSRYDAFKKGEIKPVFDVSKSGGALMDQNVYNFHYVIGLFGEPEDITYFANLEHGIDTSGTAVMSYPGFAASVTAAKDNSSPCFCMVSGTEGYILQHDCPGRDYSVTVHYRDGREIELPADTPDTMEPEFRAFHDAIEAKDTAFMERQLAQSLATAKWLTKARESAGIVFPADKD